MVFYPEPHRSLPQVPAGQLGGFKLTHRVLSVKEADRAVDVIGW